MVIYLRFRRNIMLWVHSALRYGTPTAHNYCENAYDNIRIIRYFTAFMFVRLLFLIRLCTGSGVNLTSGRRSVSLSCDARPHLPQPSWTPILIWNVRNERFLIILNDFILTKLGKSSKYIVYTARAFKRQSVLDKREIFILLWITFCALFSSPLLFVC